MPRLKSVSGSELIKLFEMEGFVVHSQKGSHVKLRRMAGNEKQTLLIPNHKIIELYAQSNYQAVFTIPNQ
jgi:predicted RNA binding protein YcfA (HicA-like mRNA interferase family)